MASCGPAQSHKVDAERGSFEYAPLPAASIRLLRLAPAQHRSERLEGTLIVASLDDDNLVYDALSYRWGDATPVESIHLGDQGKVSIAANLAYALHYLRSTHDTLQLFIDAVCIDQNDLIERSEQVTMMKRIYSKAKLVRIWIHAPSITKDSSLAAVAALSNFAQSSEDPVEAMGPSPAFWHPIIPIFSDAYWTRVWIQQEVVNASELSLHCMDAVIPGDALTKFQKTCSSKLALTARSVNDYNDPWLQLFHDLGSMTSFPARFVYASQDGREPRTLLGLLDTCRNLESEEDRDHLYGLMHLAYDYEDGSIKVDYTISRTAVMVSALEYHMRRNKNINFLLKTCLDRRVPPTDDKGDSFDVPTWVPKYWITGQNRYSLIKIYRTNMLVTDCDPPSISVDQKRLQIQGRRIELVTETFSYSEQMDEIDLKQFWQSGLGTLLERFSFGPETSTLTPRLVSYLERHIPIYLVDRA